MTRSHAFSRALRQPHVITASFDWFNVLSVSYVIGQSNYFGCGFTTLKRKPLYNQKCQQDRNNLHAFYTGLSNMRHKFNKLCTVRYLLMLTSLTGILNLVYLMFLADIKGNLELYISQRFSPVVVGRQIASVQVDSEPKVVAGSSLSYLELLNLELKDIVQRYMTSSSTISKHYEVNNLRDSKLPQQEYVYGSFVPRCSPTPFLLILVHSSPFNFMDRESIRLSWGREDNPINQGSWTHSGR